ncbi:MAG TPA: multidrug ABC transporter permease [Alphaproteobacteria bacterium]|nr:multidrug ABC transporter permease [Planctomycetaceae bacterium]HIN52889.1 multidrug ABC transporter permease [Planctomycetota bacterium]HIO03792.1 multidrug ABC transporter permease [Alphaproteobacteria bacterium]
MSAPTVPAPRMAAVVYQLCWRELVRFFRQRNRVIGSIGTPLVMWIIFGLGLDRSFSAGTSSGAAPGFLHYYFPGSLVLILMFTAIFTSISIIEDRREGFLQSVLVSPVSRSSMVLGKVLGGAIIALIQALLFLSVALFLDVSWSPGRFVALVALLFAAALMMTSLGFVFAWRMESTQGFHAIMNLVLMPMWLMSGSFFPVPALANSSAAQMAVHWCMRLNPLTYVVALVRELLYAQPLGEDYWTASTSTNTIVVVVGLILFFAAAVWISRTRISGDMR